MRPVFRAVLLSTALCAPMGLSACAGFQPMHATAAGGMAFNDLSIQMDDGENEADREAGFLIRQRLADRISVNRDAAPYRLEITPDIRRVGLGLTGQDRASRFDSVVRAEWRLVNTSDGSLVARGRAERTSSYSANRDPYQLLSTTDEANARAAREVADELIEAVIEALAESS